MVFRCCGFKLRTLTLGHVRLLESLELIAPPHLEELWMAALICSRPHQVFARRLRSLSLGLRTLISARRIRRLKFAEELSVWIAFMDYHTEPPEVVLETKKPRQTPTPFSQHLRSVLLARLNYSPETVDDVGYAQALWDYYGWMEQEGMGRVMPFSPSEREELVRAASN
jgi:hypothetical protein